MSVRYFSHAIEHPVNANFLGRYISSEVKYLEYLKKAIVRIGDGPTNTKLATLKTGYHSRGLRSTTYYFLLLKEKSCTPNSDHQNLHGPGPEPAGDLVRVSPESILMLSIALDPKVPCDGFDEEFMELLMIFAEEDTSESPMDTSEFTLMHAVNDLSKDPATSINESLGPMLPSTNEDDKTDSEVTSETFTESPDTMQSTGKTKFIKEFLKYDYRYGKQRLSPGFKKYSLRENTDLFRVTFKCGLDRHGSPCEHRIGIFHTLRDDVQKLGDGEYLYNGRKLGWGNVVPAIDKRTQGKLAQTWRAHFVIKHARVFSYRVVSSHSI